MNRLFRRRPQAPAPAMAGQASLAEGTGVSAVGDFLHRRLPVFAPAGYSSLPREGERLLLLPLEDGLCALGAQQSTEGLLPGEVRITSAGGATLWLRADGQVEINGLVITKEGTIIPPGGE